MKRQHDLYRRIIAALHLLYLVLLLYAVWYWMMNVCWGPAQQNWLYSLLNKADALCGLSQIGGEWCVAVVQQVMGIVFSVLMGIFIQNVIIPHFSFRKRFREWWKLGDPSKCMVILSCTHDPVRVVQKSETGVSREALRQSRRVAGDATHVESKEWWIEFRANTGEGQVKSLRYLLPSLQKAYADAMNWENLYLAKEPTAQAMQGKHKDCDLILLGGPASNEVTKAVLESIDDKVCFSPFDGTGVQVHLKGRTPSDSEFYQVKRADAKRERFSSEHPLTVDADAGVMIRLTHGSGRDAVRTFILAGGTTHGTELAVSYFCTRAMDNAQIAAMGERDFVAVVTQTNLSKGLSFKQPKLRYLADLVSCEVIYRVTE